MSGIVPLLQNPLNLIIFLSVMTLLVGAHELGHFLAARWRKMEIEEFAIGFGRPRWVFMRRTVRIPRKKDDIGEDGVDFDDHETEFSFRALPLGGFVKIKGMEPLEDGGEIYVRNGFYSKPHLDRLIVLFAGPLFSLLAGWLLLIPLWSALGKTGRLSEPVIGEIFEGMPAYDAGIRLGDRVVSVDGKPVAVFFDVVREVRERPGVPVKIVYERDGKQAEAIVTPRKDDVATAVLNANFEPTGDSAIQGKIGAMPKRGLVKMSVGQAATEAFLLPFKAIDSIRGIIINPRRAENEVGGMITIFAATSGAFQMGLSQLLEIAGLISISLGIMNLIPIPMFDGGQMLMALVELTRKGRRLSFSAQNAIAGVGLLMVAVLIVSVFVIDIRRWFGPKNAPEFKPSVSSPESPKPLPTK